MSLNYNPIRDSNFKTSFEKINEYEWLQNFLEQNPDVKLRWEQHKTYEILKKR